MVFVLLFRIYGMFAVGVHCSGTKTYHEAVTLILFTLAPLHICVFLFDIRMKICTIYKQGTLT